MDHSPVPTGLAKEIQYPQKGCANSFSGKDVAHSTSRGGPIDDLRRGPVFATKNLRNPTVARVFRGARHAVPRCEKKPPEPGF
jgi:hypothetical protein